VKKLSGESAHLQAALNAMGQHQDATVNTLKSKQVSVLDKL